MIFNQTNIAPNPAICSMQKLIIGTRIPQKANIHVLFPKCVIRRAGQWYTFVNCDYKRSFGVTTKPSVV